MGKSAFLETSVEPGDCILFATADWDEPYWTNKQHCARELSRLGWRVLYVESVGLRSPRLGSGKDWKRIWARIRKGISVLLIGATERQKNIWVLSPLVVPNASDRGLVCWVNQKILQFALMKHMQKHQFKSPLIWTYHPYMLKQIEEINSSKLLYHCVDDLAEIPGVDVEKFKKAETRLLKKADIVFTTAYPLKEHCQKINTNTYFLPNVVDIEHFAHAYQEEGLPHDLQQIDTPRLCYHGVLSDYKINFDLLYDAARKRRDWNWIFIGEEREGQANPTIKALGLLPNVHFLGYKPYADLPRYLSGVQVGLLPSRINNYTNSMYPMKFYEYLAAGVPVVSTPLKFLDEIASHVAIASSANEFIEAIQTQLKNGRIEKKVSRRIIGNKNWRDRTVEMLSRTLC